MVQVEYITCQPFFYRVKLFSTKATRNDRDVIRICIVITDQVFPILRTFSNNLVSFPDHSLLYLNSFCRKFVLVTLVNFTNMTECMKSDYKRNPEYCFQF